MLYVNTIVERNKILSTSRFEGLVAFVIEDRTSYELVGGTTDSNWQKRLPVIQDNTTRELYVNHTTGDDGYAGTVGSPLATIQEAVNRFKPLHLGVQNWALNDDRTINVQDPGGSFSKFQESIVIPPHAGLGALIIRGAETVHETGLAETGTPFSALAGFEVRQRLSFTTAPLTPSDPALTRQSFVVPQTNLLGNPFEYQWDMLPIVDNGDGYVDVVALDPGFLTSFSHGSGVVVDIVSPIPVWQPGPSDSAGSAFLPGACIRNIGGALIVQGFRFQTRDDEAINSTADVVLQSVGQQGDEDYGTSVHLSRCVVEQNPQNSNRHMYTMMEGDGGSISGCSIRVQNGTSPGILYPVRNCRPVAIVNLLMDTGISNSFVINSSMSCYGLDFAGNLLRLQRMYARSLYVDIRGRIDFADMSMIELLIALTVEGAGSSPAIRIGDNSGIKFFGIGRVDGSSGNTDVGLQINSSGYCLASSASSFTLSGTGGDRKCGANPAAAWGSGSESDVTEMCRLEET